MGALTYVAYAPHERELAIGCDDASINSFCTRTLNRVHTKKLGDSWIACVAYSPSGNHIAVSDADGSLYIVDSESCTIIRTVVTGGPTGFSALSYAPSGDNIAALATLRLPVADVKRLVRKSVCFSETISISQEQVSSLMAWSWF